MLPTAGITRKHISSLDSFSSFENEVAFAFADTGELAADPDEAAILISACDVMSLFSVRIRLLGQMQKHCCTFGQSDRFWFLFSYLWRNY